MNYLKNIAKDMTALTRILRARCPHFLAYSFMLMITLGAQWGSKAMELDAFTADSGFESLQGLPPATVYTSGSPAALDDSLRYVPAPTEYLLFPDDLDLPPDNFATFEIDDFLAQAAVITQLPDYSSQPENPSARPIQSIDLAQQVEVSLAQVPDQPSQPEKRKRDAKTSTQTKKYPCLDCEGSFENLAHLKRHASGHNPAPDTCPIRPCPYRCGTINAWEIHLRRAHKDQSISIYQTACDTYNKAVKAQQSSKLPSADKPAALPLGITQSPEQADTESDGTMNHDAPLCTLSAEYIYEMIASGPKARSDEHGNYTDEMLASLSVPEALPHQNVSYTDEYPYGLDDITAPLLPTSTTHSANSDNRSVQTTAPKKHTLEETVSHDKAKKLKGNYPCPHPGCTHSSASKTALELHIPLHDNALSECPLGCSRFCKTVGSWKQHFYVYHPDLKKEKGVIAELARAIYAEALKAQELGLPPLRAGDYSEKVKALLQ